MILKIPEFKDLIKKATFNLSIGSVYFNITRDKIKSEMSSQAFDVISIIDVENDIIVDDSNNNFEYDVYFNDPNTSLLSYLNLIDSEEVNLDVRESYMSIINGREKYKLNFCHPNVVTRFQSKQKDFSEFIIFRFNMNNEFKQVFNKVKKIGSKFGKIYFIIENEILSIVATDNQNAFSNMMKVELAEVKRQDINMCFDYKNISNFFGLLSDDFVVSLVYMDNLGMLEANSGGNKYFVMSKRDI